MRRPITSGKLPCLALMLAAATGVADARVASLAVDVVRSEAATLHQVEVRLDWPEDSDTGQLEMTAARLDVPALGESFRQVRWRCPLRRQADGAWACTGPASRDGGPGHPLAVSLSPAATDARLSVGAAQLGYSSLAAAPDRSRISLKSVPVAWLKAFLAGLWAPGQWTSGTLTGRVDLTTAPQSPLQAHADLALDGIGLETPDGWLAAAGLKGRLNLDYRPVGERARVDLSLTAQGGEFLAQDLYVQLPESPVILAVRLDQQADGWSLPAFSLRDAGVLEAEGSAGLAGDGAIQDLDMRLALADLGVARDRYLSGFLAPAGFADLVLVGSGSGGVAMRDGRLQGLDLRLEGINAIDPRQRFTLAGLQGDLRWTRGASAVASQLGWSSAALYGIGLGATRLGFASEDGQLVLAEPVAVPVLDGRLRLDHLRWQAPDAAHGTRFQLGATLEALDLGSLSQRLGWPPFTGTVAGRIPAARYEGGVLRLDGGLAMEVFGGRVALSDLVMERPFGVAPTLSADVAIEDVDMAPMTAAFGFGSISGRLDGRIAGLRMVDWSPVAFDARLQTDPAWKGRRRISQRAVEDISRVGGGGGLMGGLQAQALRLFDEFRYSRIGLACRLRDNICAMDGVDSAGDGYTIVEGAGLPRIQVVGFRRRVDWPTLVARLKAATEGQAPVIQ